MARTLPGAMLRAARRAALPAAALALLAAGPAAGPAAGDIPDATWRVVTDGSEVRFHYVLDGRRVSGVFETFDGTGRLAAGAPQTAALELIIDARSIDLGHRLFSAYATSAEWFDTMNHPFVVFRLARLAPDGNDGWRVIGDLTIKGETRLVDGAVALEIGETRARATGRLEVDRLAYSLGTGPSSLVVDIDPLVEVSFELNARPAD